MDSSTTNGDNNTGTVGQSAGKFFASLVVSIVVFAVQVFAFLLIKDRLARIYQPRTYLVPERERTKPVSPGWFNWIRPVLETSNSEFVQKCGLDAYFFLRYLRMLLKIFVPAALVIMPILIPLNVADGKGPTWAPTGNPNLTGVTGLDQLSWSNIKPTHTHRYWAHWILALLLVIYVCYIAFDELKNYIRMRQAYMTSPQHRLKASATTVLVSSIPDKWLSVEALDGLYDVFPGGIRNIWMNRNFDELSAKVARRDQLAKKLEAAETELIKKCFKKNQKHILAEEKAAGKKRTKEEKKRQSALLDEKGHQQALSDGLDTNNPHQVKHTIRDMLAEEEIADVPDADGEHLTEDAEERNRVANMPFIGEGLHAIGHGFNTIGKGLIGGVRGANKSFGNKVDTTNGFVASGTSGSSADARLRHIEAEKSQLQSASEPRRISDTGTDTHISADANTSPKSAVFDGASDHNRLATHGESDQLPLTKSESMPKMDNAVEAMKNEDKSLTRFQKFKKAIGFAENSDLEHIDYPKSYNDEFAGDAENAVWRKYITEKDRNTMRLPLRGWEWMPSLPLIGEKVDTIYYCRKEVARLNVEIEDDQEHPERFPYMNSAFIQFNHQVAAHMACQAVSHHLPKQMAPRVIEIDPSDVIWDNMSIPWWQSYIRTGGVVATVITMILLWAFPVAFTSALSQLDVAANEYHWLRWLLRAPKVIFSIIQGVLPPALLALLMFLLPVILRLLSRLQGMQSGVLVELSVQKYYFFFLFVQIFLVVTIAGTAVQLVTTFTSIEGVTRIPQLLGESIPRATTYFFSYMILQALSVSAGALVQVGGLIVWFLLAPILDNTGRSKFIRQISLSNIQWGTFFPVYTNLACIGLIYSVISPLILVFNIITFGLFWFVYRYQTLFVTRFTLDTGGLLFPNAINTTFAGLYVMELGLIGLFFLVRDERDQAAAYGQAIGMIIILVLTAGYQFLLNDAFGPLFRYLPITLEDDAVRRDEEFARAMRARHGLLQEDETIEDDIEERLKDQERTSLEEDRQAHEYELNEIEQDRKRRSRGALNPMGKPSDIHLQNPEILRDIDRENKGLAFVRKTANKTADATINKLPGALHVPQVNHKRGSWADRSRNRRSSAYNGASRSPSRGRDLPDTPTSGQPPRKKSPPRQIFDKINHFNPVAGDQKDLEAQRKARDDLADALFSGVNDELEDLKPEERDALVQRAFQHAALRARRPAIWIPRDDLGVSDDEIIRVGKFSKNIWITNVRQGLDAKGRAVYSGAPPDFSELDYIRL